MSDESDMGVRYRTKYPNYIMLSIQERGNLRGEVAMTLDEAEAWARDLLKLIRLRRVAMRAQDEAKTE